MDKRVILYGGVGLVIALMASSGGDGAASSSPTNLDLRQQAAIQNECMKEIIGFEQPTRSKLRFCQCVTDGFQARIAANEALNESLQGLLGTYSSLKNSPRALARGIASGNGHDNFPTPSVYLDIVLSSLHVPYLFKEVVDQAVPVAALVDQEWKNAMIECSRAEARIN